MKMWFGKGKNFGKVYVLSKTSVSVLLFLRKTTCYSSLGQTVALRLFRPKTTVTMLIIISKTTVIVLLCYFSLIKR